MSSLSTIDIVIQIMIAFCMLALAACLLLLLYEACRTIYKTFFVDYDEWRKYEARVAKREKQEESNIYFPMHVGKTTVMNMVHIPEEYMVWVQLIRGSDPQSADVANLLYGQWHVMYGKRLYNAVEVDDVIGVLARVGYSKFSGKAKCTSVKLPDN